MLSRVRRFFDVRAGEGLPVLLAFLYVACVVAAYLLAKPIRNSLFLKAYGPYALVYAYAAVPLVLSAFVAVYARLVARVGTALVTIGTLVFFSMNVVAIWYALRFAPSEWLPAVFYVWVNCFGVIASVQAWSFANSLFDVRQARRLFGLVGAGASLGSIAGGLLARFLVGPVGGTVNMLLVLAALILLAAAIVAVASRRLRARGLSRTRTRSRSAQPLFDSMRQIVGSPYLRLLAALVFLVAVATQWTNFQLSLIAVRRFGDDVDGLTAFFGTFNFVVGAAGFLLQLFVTGPALRRFGLAFAIMVLPLFIAFGSAVTLIVPVFWAVLFTNASDQSLRFSVDKAAYELLYLPIPMAQRVSVKNALDIIGNRIADAVGGILLGLATGGFFMLPGAQFGLRGTATVTLLLTIAWTCVAWQIRRAYVRAIGDSIHRHRLDTERSSGPVLDKSVCEALTAKLSSSDAEDVKYALDVLATQPLRTACPNLRALLSHDDEDIRRRAVSALAAAGDRGAAGEVEPLLRDPSPAVRTEALLFLAREGDFDPLGKIEELGDFEGFSIRSATAAFLASPGRGGNPEAAVLILRGMAESVEARDRSEAAQLLAMIPEPPLDLLNALIVDADKEVSRQALDAAQRIGEDAVPVLSRHLTDVTAPLEVRREIPSALVRIGTPSAERALIGALLDADSGLRHRVISSLNRMRQQLPDVPVDLQMLELLLAAELSGHYRSYQLLGALREGGGDNTAIIAALEHAMEQELERLFRLIALLSSAGGAMHDAYVGVRSSNSVVRANALEYLENTLRPDLRHVLLPLIDSQVKEAERIRLANLLVGAPVDTAEQALATLLASDDPWLRSRADYAWQRLTGEADQTEHAPVPADMHMDVGVG
ncbi:MAG: HEAT repeat domain-containing protein [Acidobacteria bacterium]|nr:HEAT repeat domain-containing protein [Acidobacteriota bacterium]